MRRVLLGAVACAVVLGACGDRDRSISEDGAAFLGAQVADARAAAAAGDYTRAAGVLDAIDAAVDDLLGQDDLSAERAADVSAAVAEVRGALAPFQTTTTVTTAPPPPPADDNQDDGSDHGANEEHGRGPDKGKKKDP